jgi:hypothetical protein
MCRNRTHASAVEKCMRRSNAQNGSHMREPMQTKLNQTRGSMSVRRRSRLTGVTRVVRISEDDKTLPILFTWLPSFFKALALARSRQGGSVLASGYQKKKKNENFDRALSSLMHAHRSVRLVKFLIHPFLSSRVCMFGAPKCVTVQSPPTRSRRM